MTSLRNSRAEDSLLDAARTCILAVGWKRTTLTDVARRAGVSRMTIYRRWPDMQTLLADLMTREWAAVVADAAVVGDSPVDRLARGVVRTVSALRGNALFAKIVEVDPELLLPYLLDRRGRSQDSILEMLEALIVDGQREKQVRPGDPVLIARTVLLTAQGFVLSTATMTDDVLDAEAFDAELCSLLERYLGR